MRSRTLPALSASRSYPCLPNSLGSPSSDPRARSITKWNRDWGALIINQGGARPENEVCEIAGGSGGDLSTAFGRVILCRNPVGALCVGYGWVFGGVLETVIGQGDIMGTGRLVLPVAEFAGPCRALPSE